MNPTSLDSERPSPEFTPPVYDRRNPPDLRRGKNIVICADGTGNADVKGRGSNVFKLFEAVDTTTHLYDLNVPRQIAFYDEGVGTESWWPTRVIGAAFGVGLTTNVCQLYQEIARVYQPDDRLYLFGFSRGAFTVRTLAKLINCCGILDPAPFKTRNELYQAARRCMQRLKNPDHPSTSVSDLKCHDANACRIELIGVWDTVDAVGLSFKATAKRLNRYLHFKVDVTTIPDTVSYGCQALSLDDDRKAFTPELWNTSDNVEQVWFAGAHSDIGGGYPRQGLSLIPLHWMMERARARGLRFIDSDVQYYDHHQIAADKLHNPRQATGMLYRRKRRNVVHLCRDARVMPHLHISVFDRIAQGVDGYRPTNIPAECVISFTERRDWSLLDPAALHGVLREHAAKITHDYDNWLHIGTTGRLAYVLQFATLGAAVATVLSLLATVAARLWPVVAERTGDRGATTVYLLAATLLSFALWRWRETSFQREMEDVFTPLWRDMRPDLRKALTRQDSVASARATLNRGVTTDVTVTGVSSPPF